MGIPFSLKLPIWRHRLEIEFSWVKSWGTIGSCPSRQRPQRFSINKSCLCCAINTYWRSVTQRIVFAIVCCFLSLSLCNNILLGSTLSNYLWFILQYLWITRCLYINDWFAGIFSCQPFKFSSILLVNLIHFFFDFFNPSIETVLNLAESMLCVIWQLCGRFLI